MRKRGRPPHPDILTPREWQVLDLLRQNLTNEQIAQRLDISPTTAKYHVSEILSKLGVTTREEAAGWQAGAAAAAHWWRRATAWVSRHAWPLAGAAGGLSALGMAVWVIFGASLGEGGDAATDSSASDSSQTSVALNSRIHVIRSDGSGEASLPIGVTPRWSPDGTKIAFLTGRTGGGVDNYFDGSLYVMNADGTAPTELTRVVHSYYISFCDRDRDPVWSPDGTTLAYQTGETLYTVPLKGSPPTQIGPGFGPAWSPDGQRMAYTRLGCVVANQDVDGMDSSNPSIIVGSGQEATWSPDGERLAFVRDGQIMVGSTDGSSAIAVAEVTLDIDRLLPFALTWSPDGSKLAYMHIDPETLSERLVSIYIVDLAKPGPPRNLVHVGSFDYDWSPDSGLIAYEVQEHLGNACNVDLAIYIASIDGIGEPRD